MSQYNQGQNSQNRQDNTRQASGNPSDRSSHGSQKDTRPNIPQRDRDLNQNPNRKEKDERDKGGKGGRV